MLRQHWLDEYVHITLRDKRRYPSAPQCPSEPACPYLFHNDLYVVADADGFAHLPR